MKTINTTVNARVQAYKKACSEIADQLKLVRAECFRAAHRLFNFAVKLSVVLIALIMCHNFATANPEFTANVVNTVTTTCANTLDSIQNALNGLLCNMWPF